MYKIVSIKDKEGKIKIEFMKEVETHHPCMQGEVLYPDYIKTGCCFYLVWDDDSEKMLRTSTIESVIRCDEEVIEFVTRNSIYRLEKVN